MNPEEMTEWLRKAHGMAREIRDDYVRVWKENKGNVEIIRMMGKASELKLMLDFDDDGVSEMEKINERCDKWRVEYEQKLDLSLSRIANFSRENRVSPDAVFTYFQIGQLAAAQCRQLKDEDHGDNILIDENGEPSPFPGVAPARHPPIGP